MTMSTSAAVAIAQGIRDLRLLPAPLLVHRSSSNAGVTAAGVDR
jgi:hypothetical protein